MSNQNKQKEHESDSFISTTKLPKTIQKIVKNHHMATFKIHKWLKTIGCENNWIYEDLEQMLDRLTLVSIEISHVNDYIECGALEEDPEGKLFYIKTKLTMGPIFPAADLDRITKELERFAFPEKGDRDGANQSDYVKPRNMENICLNFFSWERKVNLVDFHFNKLQYDLHFDIYHK